MPFAKLGQALGEQVVQLSRREIGFRTSDGAIQTHWQYPVLFSSKIELYLNRGQCLPTKGDIRPNGNQL